MSLSRNIILKMENKTTQSKNKTKINKQYSQAETEHRNNIKRFCYGKEQHGQIATYVYLIEDQEYVI